MSGCGNALAGISIPDALGRAGFWNIQNILPVKATPGAVLQKKIASQ